MNDPISTLAFSLQPLAFSRADRLFGEETFYAKVDTTLPERKMKAWEKKTSNGDSDE